MDTMDMPCGLTFCLQDDSCLEDGEEAITCDPALKKQLQRG